MGFYGNLRDSTHLTTHELQLRAYRTYEELLQSLPSRLADPNSLLEVADKLLHLPETFPAAYLQIYDPIIPICLKLSTAQYIADLFFAVADIPSDAMLQRSGLLDGGPFVGIPLPGRTAGLPIVLGFPETERRITDLQVNVPPAAIVASLAGRAYRTPTCPHTVYEKDQDGLPVIQGRHACARG